MTIKAILWVTTPRTKHCYVCHNETEYAAITAKIINGVDGVENDYDDFNWICSECLKSGQEEVKEKIIGRLMGQYYECWTHARELEHMAEKFKEQATQDVEVPSYEEWEAAAKEVGIKTPNEPYKQHTHDRS